MENIKITNTRLEGEEIVVFVSFDIEGKIIEDTLRFPMFINGEPTSVPYMLSVAGEKLQFYIQREQRIKEIYEETRQTLINEE